MKLTAHQKDIVKFLYEYGHTADYVCNTYQTYDPRAVRAYIGSLTPKKKRRSNGPQRVIPETNLKSYQDYLAADQKELVTIFTGTGQLNVCRPLCKREKQLDFLKSKIR